MENNEENIRKYLVHHCKGYIENVQHLSLSREVSQRAKRCGFNVVGFTDSCLKAITHNVSGHNYDDMAKIVDGFADVAILFLKKYQDVEVAHFRSNDTQEEFIIYPFENHRGYIIVGKDENREPSVRATNGMEIWRYLADPLRTVEAVISTIIAYAERHQSVKDDWLFTLEDVES